MLPGPTPHAAGYPGTVPPGSRGSAGRGTKSDHKDIMSLAGLLTILDDDPQLSGAVARARGGQGQEEGPADVDLVAPPTLRPVLVAALAHPARPGAPGPGGNGGSSPG